MGRYRQFAFCYGIKSCCYVQFLICCVYKTLSYDHFVSRFDKTYSRCVQKELRSVYFTDRCGQSLSRCADYFSGKKTGRTPVKNGGSFDSCRIKQFNHSVQFKRLAL